MKNYLQKSNFTDLSIFILEGFWHGTLKGIKGSNIKNTFEIYGDFIFGKGILEYPLEGKVGRIIRFHLDQILIEEHTIKMNFRSSNFQYFGTQTMELDRQNKTMEGHYKTISQENGFVMHGNIFLKKAA